ncbi:MAG: VWA domain-containing protein, partial [Planctomycetota bacterium]
MKSIKNLLIRIFPPPRLPVTFGRTLPLVIFLILFFAAWFLLEYKGIILFSSSKPLWLLIFSPWIWWTHINGFSGLSGFRSLTALIIRLSLAGLFIMVMAEPRAIRKSDALSVVYTLDVSDSIGEKAADDALAYIIKTVSEKPEKDEAGLVVFGQDAAVELPPRISFPFEIINSRIAKDGTNIERGLSLAAAVLPEENNGKIVLITDGAQTEGISETILDDLKARGITVEVLPIQYEFEDEVWLEKLEMPNLIKAEQTYEAVVILSSLKDGNGKLTLRENGEIIYEGNVDFVSGKNRYVLPLYLRKPGFYEYEARIEVAKEKDGWQNNNIALNHIYVKGEGSILVVTSPNGKQEDWNTIVKALKERKYLVETISAFQLPNNAMSLMPYNCIILPNVPSDAFDAIQLSTLRDSVYNQGIGLLMVGGKDSFGPGGYHRTPVEEALPVTMDISHKKVMPKGALVIILHTCEFSEGNTWGKRIAKEAIRVLGAKDEVGILLYDFTGGEKWLFQLTPAEKYDYLCTLINNAQIGDMPSFSNTMKMGLDALKASDAAMKHMIIISDGDPSPPTPQM